MRRSVKEKMGIVIALTVFACAVMLPVPQKVYAAVSEFSDLPTTHWAYDSVQEMQKSGIIKGYSDGTFKPSKTVTYAEFIKMVVVALNGDDGLTKKYSSVHWAADYCEKAVEKAYFNNCESKNLEKIVSTLDSTEFQKDPVGYSKKMSLGKVLDSPIDRADMSVLISNASGKFSGKLSKDRAKIYDEISDVDNNTIGCYEIANVYDCGIISGYPDGSFKPEGTLTRAEAGAVIYRTLKLKEEYGAESQKITNNYFEQLMSLPPEYVDENGEKWFRDMSGMYKWVKTADYVSLPKGEHYEEYYNIFEYSKFYADCAGMFEEDLSFDETDRLSGFDFPELKSLIVGLKDKELLNYKNGIHSFPVPYSTMVGFDRDFNPSSPDYYLALTSYSKLTSTDIYQFDEEAPMIFANPLKDGKIDSESLKARPFERPSLLKSLEKSSTVKSEDSNLDENKYTWETDEFGAYRTVLWKDYVDKLPVIAPHGTINGKAAGVAISPIAKLYKKGEIEIKIANRIGRNIIKFSFPQNSGSKSTIIVNGIDMGVAKRVYSAGYENYGASYTGRLDERGVQLSEVDYFLFVCDTRKIVDDNSAESGYSNYYEVVLYPNPFR